MKPKLRITWSPVTEATLSWEDLPIGGEKKERYQRDDLQRACPSVREVKGPPHPIRSADRGEIGLNLHGAPESILWCAILRGSLCGNAHHLAELRTESTWMLAEVTVQSCDQRRSTQTHEDFSCSLQRS
jgi:hypothetical protein